MLLPGAGSDEVFIQAAFVAPLRAIGMTVRTPRPLPGVRIVEGFVHELDSALSLDPASESSVSMLDPASESSVSMLDPASESSVSMLDPASESSVSMLDPASESSVSMLDPASESSVSMLDPASESSVSMLDPASESSVSMLDPASESSVVRPSRRLLVGGVSLGAHIAVRWAARRLALGLTGPDGLLLALPAWTGRPAGAPAARAATASATAVRNDGLTATLAHVRAGVPCWLSEELARAWNRHGSGLADSLEVAASTVGPTEAQLATLDIPIGLVGLSDDPLHPETVARHWHGLLPRSALVTSTLDAVGRDRATLGRAAALAWLRAVQMSDRAVPVSRGGGVSRAARPPWATDLG